MACKIFGAIDVGSYEVNLKVYELSARNGIRVLNHVRHRMELGKDAYATGKISTELVDELCGVLNDFQRIMKEFGVEEYRPAPPAPSVRRGIRWYCWIGFI